MTDEVQRLAEGFIRCLARECGSCLRRSDTVCRNCYCRTANYIVQRMDGKYGTATPVETLLVQRTRRILDILVAAGRPLLASEIDVSDICSKQVKCWTLNRMVGHGTIDKTAVGGGRRGEGVRFIYSVHRNYKKTKVKP